MQTLKESTNNDPQLVMLKEYIEKGCWPEQRKRADSLVQPFWHVRFDLHIIEGIVMKDNKIVIPTDMQQYILSIIHSAHLGINKCKAKARNALYWPGMSSQIEDLVLACLQCLQLRNSNQEEPMGFHEIPELPWTKNWM